MRDYYPVAEIAASTRWRRPREPAVSRRSPGPAEPAADSGSAQATPATTTLPQPIRFRVVTWNIHKGVGGLDRRYLFERAITVLRALAPDIVLLQEVAKDMPRSRFDDQGELLREALGLPFWAFALQHRFRHGGYGNGILSRWPLHDVVPIDLTLPGRKRRGALHATVRLRSGAHSRTVALLVMHLGLADSERAEQLRLCLASPPVDGMLHRTPVVLGGDFNDLWGTLGARFLEPAGFVRAGRRLRTFPAWLPMRPLDAIFHRGDLVVRGSQTLRSRLTRRASDHLPLAADFELLGQDVTSTSPLAGG